MSSPDSDDLFDELENSNPPRVVNIEVQFGNPDYSVASEYPDHSEIIENVHFEGSYSQTSIEDRNVNQISYPFIGRCLKGGLVTV